MAHKGSPESHDAIARLLQACTEKKDLGRGRQVRAFMIQKGLDSVAYLVDHLIRFFTACGSLPEANDAFSKVSHPSVYTWHAIISAHARLGESGKVLDLYNDMQQASVVPNKFVFLCVLKSCSNMRDTVQGRLYHDQITSYGFGELLIIQNTLVDMYAKCARLEEARYTFDRLEVRDVVSWGAMISGYATCGLGTKAVELFQQMQSEGLIEPNAVIFVCTLQACASNELLEQGQLLHELIICNGLQSDGMIGSALIGMYSKCGSLEEACKVFDNLPDKDVVSWGAVIEGYAQHGHSYAAFALYKEMVLEGFNPTKVTFLSMLKACASSGLLAEGRLVHKQVVIYHFDFDITVGNLLVDMYSKCQSLEEAHAVFEGLPSRDGVSWNAMIQGFVQHNYDIIAMELYIKMQDHGIKAGKVTLVSMLKACGNVGATIQGRQLHDKVIRRGYELDLTMESALVESYAKCASMAEAQKVFNKMRNRDVISWGTIITGYAQCGDWVLARRCLHDMQCQGCKPDSWIFSSILAACGHAGQVDEGQNFLKSMIHDHGIKPSMEHFNCMVDLLGRAGHLKEAKDMVQSMPLQPDANGWTSMIASCRMYGDKVLGSDCFTQAVQIDWGNASGFIHMASIYADADMLMDAKRVQEMQTAAGLLKKPGRALIEFNDSVQEFIMGDKAHSEHFICTAKSRRLRRKMEELGYVPRLEAVSDPKHHKGEILSPAEDVCTPAIYAGCRNGLCTI